MQNQIPYPHTEAQIVLGRLKYGLVAVAAIILALVVRGCFKDKQLPAAFNLPLPVSSFAQVIVQDHHIAVRSQLETKAGYVPDGGQAITTINKDGTVKLDIQSAGFLLRPVVGTMIATHPRLMLGAQLGYWGRFEIYGGGAVGLNQTHLAYPCGFAGLGYRLDQIKLNNTSVYVAYTTAQEIGAGFLVRF